VSRRPGKPLASAFFRFYLTSKSFPRSYTRDLLESREKYFDLDDVELNQQPGSLFGAGVDTTSSTLQSFILALVSHPECQKLLHDEMDSVIGQDRAPTWDDEKKLVQLEVCRAVLNPCLKT